MEVEMAMIMEMAQFYPNTDGGIIFIEREALEDGITNIYIGFVGRLVMFSMMGPEDPMAIKAQSKP